MSETSMIAEELIPPVIRDAAKRGMSFPDLLSVITRSVADAYPLPEARFAAAGIGGRRALMAKEGGCLPAKEAAAAYLGSHPSKKPQAETARRAAREHRLIAIHDGHGDLLFPLWQFKKTGGALDELPQVLHMLRTVPGYSEITPFIFFLQPHPRTKGTPLAALRVGDLKAVLAAAESEKD